jgi:hypothetical protein
MHIRMGKLHRCRLSRIATPTMNPIHNMTGMQRHTPGLRVGSVFVRLVVLSGVVGPYLLQDIWFPSHLPLERTDHIQNFEP